VSQKELEEGLRPTLWDREELSQFKVALVGEKERERIQIITQKMNVIVEVHSSSKL